MKKFEMCWELLDSYFLDLKDCLLRRKSDKEQEGRVDDRMANPSKVFLSYVFQMLYYACKLWKTDEDRAFKDMLLAVKKLEPRAADLCAILEARVISIHVLRVQLETRFHHEGKEVDNLIMLLCNLYTKYTPAAAETNKPNESILPELSTVQMRARVLCDLHLVLNDISPLTVLQRTNESEDEDDENGPHRRSASSTELNLQYQNELLEATKRMNILLSLYPQLPLGYLKAKASYALGLYATFTMEDTRLAEQLFFEGLYTLDLCTSLLHGMPYVVSELGTNILLRYSEILLTNYKYLYAIVSYESVIALLKLRGITTRLFSLLRQLSSICQENEDYKRAREFYKELLDTYSGKYKINEVLCGQPLTHYQMRYVSEVLSSLYLEEGDFRRAESLLHFALSAVPENSVDSDRIDPIRFRLFMKLVDLHLNSYNYEKGIELLEDLKESILPQGTKYSVLAKLAESYMKKRLFKESFEVLRELQNELEATSTASIKLSPEKLLQLWELYTLAYYYSHQYTQALLFVDTAIISCPPSNLSSLSRYHYLRGKIFQSLCSSASTLQFPTNLKPSQPFVKPDENITPRVYYFMSTGDLIQECIASYDKAYSYFRIIGDDLNIAKTVTRIAATCLERTFCPFALLHIPYSDLSRFPYFEVSDIAKQEKKLKKSKPDPQEAPKEFVVSFERIENPTVCALEICAQTYNPMLMAKK